MSKIIDLILDFPPTANNITEKIKLYTLNKEGKGLANYRRIFGPRLVESLGVSFESLYQKKETLSEDEYDSYLTDLSKKIVQTSSSFKKVMEDNGIEWGLVQDIDDDRIPEIVSQIPDKLKGNHIFKPFMGFQGIRDMERAVIELGCKAAYVSPYRWGIKANDPRFYPCYVKALELDIPVFIYTSMNYRTDYPMDIGHPRNIDRVAMDFPELRIVASCGGWPWVPDLIGVARRHKNVYIDTSSVRPKYLAIPGSGYEMLMQYGNTLLQDQIVFGSGANDLGLPLVDIVAEMKTLPLKPSVKEKWLYYNALKLFRMD
ncbi:amidohydrolase [bacterium]|nr:amidohydrolase [bacterium]